MIQSYRKQQRPFSFVVIYSDGERAEVRAYSKGAARRQAIRRTQPKLYASQHAPTIKYIARAEFTRAVVV